MTKKQKTIQPGTPTDKLLNMVSDYISGDRSMRLKMDIMEKAWSLKNLEEDGFLKFSLNIELMAAGGAALAKGDEVRENVEKRLLQIKQAPKHALWPMEDVKIRTVVPENDYWQNWIISGKHNFNGIAVWGSHEIAIANTRWLVDRFDSHPGGESGTWKGICKNYRQSFVFPDEKIGAQIRDKIASRIEGHFEVSRFHLLLGGPWSDLLKLLFFKLISDHPATPIWDKPNIFLAHEDTILQSLAGYAIELKDEFKDGQGVEALDYYKVSEDDPLRKMLEQQTS